MSLYDIFVQLLGVIAWLILVFSYYFKKENTIIFMQVLATIVYCIHYFLLGAYSGLYICSFEVVRDFLYYKTNKDNYIFAFSLPIYVLFGYLSYKEISDLMPIFASVVDGFSLLNKRKIILFCAVVTYTLWVLYDINVGSYSTMVTDGLVALSNLSLLLLNKSLFKNDKLNKILCK